MRMRMALKAWYANSDKQQSAIDAAQAEYPCKPADLPDFAWRDNLPSPAYRAHTELHNPHRLVLYDIWASECEAVNVNARFGSIRSASGGKR